MHHEKNNKKLTAEIIKSLIVSIDAATIHLEYHPSEGNTIGRLFNLKNQLIEECREYFEKTIDSR